MLASSNAVTTSSKRAHHAPYPRCLSVSWCLAKGYKKQISSTLWSHMTFCFLMLLSKCYK